jgi:uncharacterized protein (UPF0332 family)
MDAAEFVAFAGRNVSQGKAGARSAISRAYYGVFHAALAILQELAAESPGSGKAHNLVAQYLFGAKHPAASAVARIITGLHGDRIEADYRLSSPLPEDLGFAKSKVELAADSLKLLDQFRNECRADPTNLQALRDGIARVKEVHQA